MVFSELEKLSIFKVLDEIILADERVDDNELSYLNQIGDLLDFNLWDVSKAREMSAKESLSNLKKMPLEKKNHLFLMMHEMANSDGNIDEEELNVIMTVFFSAELDQEPVFENLKKGIDLNNIYFVSSDHLRYERGIHASGPHGGAKRAIKVEPNINGNLGYTVTVFNLDGNHPLWGTNVQVAPKPMKVIETSESKTILRGYGSDPNAMGNPAGNFANYGISIFHPNGRDIEKIILHMHDRKVDLEYLK